MNSIEGKVIKFNKPGELGYKRDCLNIVGKVISDKEINIKAYKNALLGIWGNPQDVAITDIGSKKLLFSFKERKKGLQIMQNGPWNVKGNMVNLRLWREGESVFEVDHDFMEFWIQVHGIPHDLMEKETGIVIGEMLGVLAEVEDPKVDGVLRRSYLRIRVSINITKALPTGFWLDREEIPPLWVFFKIGSNRRGGTSKQQEGNDTEDDQAREQRNPRQESDEQSSEESRIRSEQAQQRKFREESVRENQIGIEKEMAEDEEQVEEAQKIPDFRDDRDILSDLGAVMKFKNLIMDIRERKVEWASNIKAHKGSNGEEAQKTSENGLMMDIRPIQYTNPQKAANIERSGLNKDPTEEIEVNSYKTEKWKMGQENIREKETMGQELKRLMLARMKDEQVNIGRMDSRSNQEVGRRGMQDKELSKPLKETMNRELDLVSQHGKVGENVYFVELASDEDEEKAAEEQAEWEAKLAKKLEVNLTLKRKRENSQVPMLTYNDRKEEQEGNEHKKMKNVNTAVEMGELELAIHVPRQNRGIHMAEEAGLNTPQPQP
ncbi:hypothetical protein Ahy_Scaffold1g106660 isoform A [Arachis hypogaea]|uniref:DUF4283 domain-containing protein n=1 Tax=Arachis hypogaea TaxID=3818 RepID=A0A444WR46_ARAHY|nr:hypothetical protein Ahy_Scaffold1g106660 isoform A [Arachis hypogaea]